MIDVEKILDKYNLEYTFHKSYLELWRNGRTVKLNYPIDLNFIEMYLNDFCVYSPASTSVLKEQFPFYFEEPKPGEWVFVKKADEYINCYQIRKFKEFRNGKIVCVKEIDENSETEREYSFYSRYSNDDRHPSTTFWFNGLKNHLTWAVMEAISVQLFKPKKYIN